jgi:hypothetical protein
MADRDILERIDRQMERTNLHLERSNLYMERGNELMGEIREEMRLSREQRARSDAMFDDLKVFMRDITLRVERGGREMVAELRELREESRAPTQALMRMIDRMDRLDPPGAAA